MTEITETSDSPAGTVIFDDDCGMCARSIARLRPLLEPRGFRFQPFPPGTDKPEMKLQLPGGLELGGATALLHLVRAVWWLRPLAWLAGIPGVLPLLQRAYRKVAAHRYGISSACGWTPSARTAAAATAKPG